MRILLLFIFLQLGFFCFAQNDLIKTVSEKAENLLKENTNILNHEITDLIHEILDDASTYAINQAKIKGGFNENHLIRIKFPLEAKKIKDALKKIGMKKQIHIFEDNMNASAEHASNQALAIFKQAINNMNIDDAYSIINGEDDAATSYLKRSSIQKLNPLIKMIISSSMKDFKVLENWENLISSYNKIPFSKKIDFDLEEYITSQTINGLFILMQSHEKIIRKDIELKINTLLNSGESALRIIASLNTQIRGCLWVSLLEKENKNDVNFIAKAAGIANPKRIYVIRKQIRGKSSNLFINLLNRLLEIEIALKKGTKPFDAFKDGLLT